MTKSKKHLKEAQAAYEASAELKALDQNLESFNDAYTKGAFKYLRFLVHLLGTAQFSYGIYYYWFNVNWPELPEEDELQARWGGKFKYLTFLNVILQANYHCIALLNDLFGTNALASNDASLPLLRKIKDYTFVALAFPIAHNVCISFWVIYAFDRELIFPAELDAIFPNWLNHVVHTNVAMLAIMDLFTCFRRYPSRLAGLAGTVIFMLFYIIWLHIVRYFSGQWVYPLLEVLSFPFRYIMLAAMLGFTVLCYFLGEYLNNINWASELKLLSQRTKKQK